MFNIAIRIIRVAKRDKRKSVLHEIFMSVRRKPHTIKSVFVVVGDMTKTHGQSPVKPFVKQTIRASTFDKVDKVICEIRLFLRRTELGRRKIGSSEMFFDLHVCIIRQIIFFVNCLSRQAISQNSVGYSKKAQVLEMEQMFYGFSV